MLNEEKLQSLQRWMNYRIKNNYSIILMSRKSNALYNDKILNDWITLEYEWHDAPKKIWIEPKKIDQQKYSDKWILTQSWKFIEPEIISQMTFLALELRKEIKIPMWICCLWNDWKAWLSIAKVANLDFVRIPVFVDKIQTNYWFIIEEKTSEILEYKNKIQAQNIKIITDIHVKHSTILNPETLIESAKNAINSWSDWLIITWNWTWDLPKFEDLENVRKEVWDFPIIIWSWIDEKNIKNVLEIVDAMIVWTSLKTKKFRDHNINIKAFEEEMDVEKVKKLMSLI